MEQVLALLHSPDDVCDGGEISELAHALKTATRAEQAAADDEVVLAALLHDIGKVFGDAGRAYVSAGVLAPTCALMPHRSLRHHGAFTTRHWDSIAPGEPDPRDELAGQPWFELAVQSVDEWDMESFDPPHAHGGLGHFDPLVRRLIVGP